MDDKVVKAASLSIQAHEEFYHLMSKLPAADGGANDLLLECRSIMDQLRLLKSKVEGSHLQLVFPPKFEPPLWSQLQNLVLMHTPSSLLEQDKAKMATLIAELLSDCVKEVVYCCMQTCPWLASAGTNTSKQMKRNRLFVVYVATDEQFFSLATQHERKLADVVDQDFLYAAEVRQFCAELLNGNVRYIEALNAPSESLIISSPHWLKLGTLLNPRHLLGQKFKDRCLGQAVMSLAKRKHVKQEESSLVLNGDVPLEAFCDSFRLLSHLESIVQGSPLCCWSSNFPSDGDSKCVQEAMRLLREAFKGSVQKEVLFEYILDWKKQLCDAGLLDQGGKGNSEEIWTAELGKWLTDVRMGSATLSLPPRLPDEERSVLLDLFSRLELHGVEPEQVLVVCEAGSKLYNLSLPTSDSDYIIIFQHPTEAILSSLNPLKEMQDSRGKQQLQEAGAYEARMFCEMLLKGSVNMFELIYADPVMYSNKAWLELTCNKNLFLSEKVILQYIGFIKTHMQRIKSEKFSGSARERKLFYNVFHKLLSLEGFVERQAPVVRCTGPERDFIMKIRTGPLEGDLAPGALYCLAEERLAKARDKLRARTYRHRELGDYKYLQRWLSVNVRGLPV